MSYFVIGCTKLRDGLKRLNTFCVMLVNSVEPFDAGRHSLDGLQDLPAKPPKMRKVF